MQTVYAVKGHQGAHILEGMRECLIIETPGGPYVPTVYADLRLIGAISSYSALASDVTPYTAADAITSSHDLIVRLAQEAVTVYGLDPGRVQRAADLMRNPYNVQQARRDEIGETIAPTLNKLIVKGSKGGWYIVTRGWCQCIDNTHGNTCKHRIAAWMYRESIVRPLAQARRVAPAVVMAELTTLIP